MRGGPDYRKGAHIPPVFSKDWQGVTEDNGYWVVSLSGAEFELWKEMKWLMHVCHLSELSSGMI